MANSMELKSIYSKTSQSKSNILFPYNPLHFWTIQQLCFKKKTVSNLKRPNNLLVFYQFENEHDPHKDKMEEKPAPLYRVATMCLIE